ncbi:hypothetical protein LJR098_003329 [Rhizobium sp. LjRoot98]|uniref:hypothetical protein n=1 Tax=Rhizobium sp. LjRoot98 TaxID=3342345 RepID=UPI003ECE5598
MPDPQPKPFSYVPVRVTTSDRVTIGHVRYRMVREYPGEIILETEGDDPRRETFTEQEFSRRHLLGEIIIDEGYHSLHKKIPEVIREIPWRNIKPHKRAKAQYFENLIRAYERYVADKGPLPRTVDELGPKMLNLSMEALEVTRKALAGETVHFKKLISVGHFNKIYANYQQSGRKTAALVSKDQGNKRVYYYDEASLKIWREEADLYAHSQRPKKKDKYEDLVARIRDENAARPDRNKLELCSYKVFRRLINELGAYYVVCKRYSKAVADRKFKFDRGGFGLFRPGERVDIDEKVVDLMLLLQYAHIWETLSDDEKEKARRVRVWVIVAMDIATRYIFGMRFCMSPNAQATIDVIQMMMQDKSETSAYVGALSPWFGRCRPETICTDNGSGLVNEEVADVLVECEIPHIRPNADHPEARGHIESSFRSHRRIVRHYQGRTFKDVLEKAGYDPVKTASLPLDLFEQEYTKAILDVYHNTPHEGLGGETPHNSLIRQTQTHKMRPHIGPDILRHIFGMDDTRTLDGEGLRFLGVPYSSPELRMWMAQDGQVEVPIRVNKRDMASISYLRDGKWYIADNQIGLAPDISVAEWLVVWRRIGGDFKKGSEVALDLMYAGLRDLRESGDAAAYRNPLGLRDLTAEKVREAERALIYRSGIKLIKATQHVASLDPPVVRPSAFIDDDAAGFNDPVAEISAYAEAQETARAQAFPKVGAKPTTTIGSPSPSSRRSQVGSASSLKF